MVNWRLYLDALCRVQDLLFLLQISRDDHRHVQRIFLEPILRTRSLSAPDRDAVPPKRVTSAETEAPPHLQVPLDLSDVVLLQELVLQGEAAVLVVQLGQEVVEPNPSQRVLHRHRFP